MLNIEVTYCTKCLHYNSEDQTCNAFPNQIPKEILTGKLKHSTKYPEQVGNDVFEDRIKWMKENGLDTTYEDYPDDIIYVDGAEG